MTALEAFAKACKKLASSQVSEPEAKAKVIISHALSCGFSEVFSDVIVPESAQAAIDAMLARCSAGEPVEYVTGKAYFRYLELAVTPYVLIPRKETELVAGKAIELIKTNGYRSALDMCAGSGCIGISLATETGISVTAADISDKALSVAKANALANCAAGMEFIISDMFENISEAYDIIVCNPPYVSDAEYASLDNSVRLYEPSGALLAGDGLDFYRRIANDSPAHINKGGALVLEIGCTQAQQVIRLLAENGFRDIEYEKDYEGRDRILSARVK